MVPKREGQFVVAAHFKVGENDGVRIGSLSGSFKQRFLGKIETPDEKRRVCGAELGVHSVDGAIIASLGGEEKVEISLAALWFLLDYQSKWDEHILTEWYTNIFYVRDTSSVLCTIGIDWNIEEDEFLLFAYSVDDRRIWSRGSRIFYPIY